MLNKMSLHEEKKVGRPANSNAKKSPSSNIKNDKPSVGKIALPPKNPKQNIAPKIKGSNQAL